MTEAKNSDYWFPAKRYGWGWGLPQRWQGWVVMSVYLALMALLIFVFPPDRQMLAYLASVTVLSALLVFICWLKGEPPKWRWG